MTISAASLSVVPVGRPEFPPPAHLSEAEKAVFRDLVGSVPAAHFHGEDRELVALYAIHVAELHRLAKVKRRPPDRMRAIGEATRLIVSLAVKLRLGPKSRRPNDLRGSTTGLPTGRRPWEPAESSAPDVEARSAPVGGEDPA